MTRKEAQDILGITDQADDRTIKSRFRELMTRYHPDAVGSGTLKTLRRAQLINEAYSLLRRTPQTERSVPKEESRWKGKTVGDAFAERIIYRAVRLWEGEETRYEEAAKGKYEWDPELEDFDCFLRSVNRAAMELLEEAEERSGICRDNKEQWKQQRFAYQVRLFHLLAGQLIRPVFCLEKLAVPEETDETGRKIYRFRGCVGAKGSDRAWRAMTRLKKGDLLKASSLQNNRIQVSDGGDRALGHLSLAEDQWYYVVIPILERRLAQVKIVVKDVEISRSSHPYRVRANVDLYLRLEKTEGPEREPDADRNRQIRSLLDQYEVQIRKG